ncbi:MAG TPA: heme lyase CcmF/NrfE family subunit [Xanthobacteraceae bacterium]|nr:heme lyase CcmF/NrfE family subunit [Xanthobacteraceae bacterium]
MIAELGHFALVLAFALASLQAGLSLWGAARRDFVLMRVAAPMALAGLGFVAFAFAALVAVYVQSDFSVAIVYANSHSAQPLLYKVTGVWGNHEGSMLLWVLVLALFSALVAFFGGNLPARLRANVLGIEGMIAAIFLLFILTTSNPFLRLDPPPAEGRELNPILQDIGLAIHPPLLYLGYVGFSITFAFAIAALIEGRVDAAWARWVRPWTLAAWIFLTLGIAMGSYWAYYELGWGGYWFWDPVENASLMPWLAGTALLHSALVMEKRDALKIWTTLLAILTFSLSLLGTFLVRSGVLTSVHTFANDPARGVFILAILTLFVGGSLALFAWRAPLLRPGGLFAPVSREGALVLNNLFLSAAAATILTGTLYPLALEALTGAKISVGAPFFNRTAGPLFLCLLVLMPAGPLLAWKRGDLAGVAERLVFAAALAAAVAGLSLWLVNGGPLPAVVGLLIALYVMTGALVEFADRIALFREPIPVSLGRAAGLPRSAFGMLLAHFGIGVVLLGIVAEGGWSEERIVALKAGDQFSIGQFELQFKGLIPRQGPNWRDQVGRFEVRKSGVVVATLEPAKRTYIADGQTTTEAGIETFGFGQLYASLGDQTADGVVSARIYWKPLVALIWLGGVVMAIGGAFSISDRRFRIGAPQPARRRAIPAPAE